MSDPVWLPVGLILGIHERQIAEHGGLAGVRDQGLLESGMARPMIAYAYGEKDLCALAALYAAGIVKNHPFADGNKRTGFVACELFLAANALSLDAPDEECIAMTLALASGEADVEAYAAWLRVWTKPN
ncbi:MAG: type II toxin-antitoxin system death-on-curing family toxin [Alphaproteobacteria bacterium]